MSGHVHDRARTPRRYVVGLRGFRRRSPAGAPVTLRVRILPVGSTRETERSSRPEPPRLTVTGANGLNMNGEFARRVVPDRTASPRSIASAGSAAGGVGPPMVEPAVEEPPVEEPSDDEGGPGGGPGHDGWRGPRPRRRRGRVRASRSRTPSGGGGSPLSWLTRPSRGSFVEGTVPLATSSLDESDSGTFGGSTSCELANSSEGARTPEKGAVTGTDHEA